MIYEGCRGVRYYMIAVLLLLSHCLHSKQIRRNSTAVLLDTENRCKRRQQQLEISTMHTNEYDNVAFYWSGSPELIKHFTVGDSARLKCDDLRDTFGDKSPPIIIRWTKYETNLTQTSSKFLPFGCRTRRSPFLYHQRLLIRDLNINDSGLYSCQMIRSDTKEIVAFRIYTVLVKNREGNSIPVKATSSSLKSLQTHSVITASDQGTFRVSLNCAYYIDGLDEVIMTWYHEERNLSYSNSTMIACNSGLYTCSVRNHLGGFSHTFDVLQKAINCSTSPKTTRKPSQWLMVVVILGGTIILCSLSSVAFCCCKTKPSLKRKKIYMGYGMYIESNDDAPKEEEELAIVANENDSSVNYANANICPNTIRDYCALYHQLGNFPAISTAVIELVKTSEVPRERLHFEYLNNNRIILGSGYFGKVYKGNLSSSDLTTNTPVAVKVLRDGFRISDFGYFIEEAFILIQAAKHPNVISILGTCILDSTIQKTPCLIMELANGGNLLSFLLQRCTTSPTTIDPTYYTENVIKIEQLLSFAHQIALGMEHLSKKKILHRDLAARNILLTDTYMIKIGDFGLSKYLLDKDYYRVVYRREKPVKWTAPEALKFDKYTVESDVWSFGVLVWEILTLGQDPYPNVEPRDLYDMLRKGMRLSKPELASQEIYKTLLLCWQWEPTDRTNFSSLAKILFERLEEVKDVKDTKIRDVGDKSTESSTSGFSDESESGESATPEKKTKQNTFSGFHHNTTEDNACLNQSNNFFTRKVLQKQQFSHQPETAIISISETQAIMPRYDTFENDCKSSSSDSPLEMPSDKKTITFNTVQAHESRVQGITNKNDGLNFENKSYVTSNRKHVHTCVSLDSSHESETESTIDQNIDISISDKDSGFSHGHCGYQ